ncbi:YhfL family protein [Salmonella enterica subsp. enterica serovar Dublin]|nr:YhfL family protein [Salmonella enterica]WDX21683.1 YhfL family protein [Salmonella enterica subsp. enterica serovar Dublin]
MFKFVKIAVVAGVLATLTACTGHIENKKNNCSYDYLLHPAISISKIIGGCGPAADQYRNDCADTKKPGFSPVFLQV